MAGTTNWSSSQDVFEFRGVDNLVFAEILEDSDERYLTGVVYNLSPTAEISRNTSNSTEAHYYDNKPLIIITSTGSDEVKLVVAPPKLDVYAMITGQTFVSRLGMLIEGARKDKDFAIGYRTKGTDGRYRYVWRLKGKFGIPDETHATEDDGTDANNTELTFTCVNTVHIFDETKESAKAIVVDERFGKAILDNFFDTVQTPDTVQPLTVVATPTFDPPATSSISGDIFGYKSSIGYYPVEGKSIDVSISCDTVGATVYYTTTGATPTKDNGTKYESLPVHITATTYLRAIAYKNGLADSKETICKYELLEEDK